MAPAHTYQIHYVCLISPLIGCAYSGIPSSPPSADYFISAYLVFFRFLTMHSFGLRFQRVRVIVYSLVMLWNCIHFYSSTTSCRHVTTGRQDYGVIPLRIQHVRWSFHPDAYFQLICCVVQRYSQCISSLCSCSSRRVHWIYVYQ